MGGKSDMERVDIGGSSRPGPFKINCRLKETPAVHLMMLDLTKTDKTWTRHMERLMTDMIKSMDHKLGPRNKFLIPFPKESFCKEISCRIPNQCPDTTHANFPMI